MNRPRVIIAGTGSGCGKTIIASGLMAALVKKGIRVQPFKVGPDYIDPMFHTFATGRYSRNLDSWMLKENILEHLFFKNSSGCDISVVEGVMGLYDGFGGRYIEGSTAHVSRILECPVILVLNAQGMSLSAAAMIKGYIDFKGGACVRGVILNRINKHSLFLHLKDIIEDNTGVKVLGYIPYSENYKLPQRHLGLVPGEEVPGFKDSLERLAQAVDKTVDLELLMKIAKDTPELAKTPECAEISVVKPGFTENRPGFIYRKAASKIRIAVALDRAFNFYYRDNIELLEDLGAELVYFSPLDDNSLPEKIHGVYFGGGYPEVFAQELSNNHSMRKDVKASLSRGLPAYAECGGLMYLCRSLEDIQGGLFEMAGFFPAQCKMTNSLKRFGYVNVNILKSCILGNPGYTIRAHEFHYSTAVLDKSVENTEICSCYDVFKQRKEGKYLNWTDGWKLKNTLAGYPHIHFWSDPRFAAKFVESCFVLKRELKNI